MSDPSDSNDISDKPIRLQELIPSSVAIEPNSVLREIGLDGRVEWGGTKITVPEGMQPQEALVTFTAAVRQMNEHLKVVCTRLPIEYPYNEVLIATDTVLRREFDLVETDPASVASIAVGVDATRRVEMGTRTLVDLGGAEVTVEYGHEDSCLHIHARREYAGVFEALQEAVITEIKKNSIYRGKALDGELNFLDFSTVKPDDVIYNSESRRQLVAYLWNFITRTNLIRARGLSLKRSVLLTGDYGTGKTLTGYLTALLAVDNEMTFFAAVPGQDNLESVMRIARLYQPCVVYYEDIDTAIGTDDEDLRDMLDMFDGLDAKNNEIILLMTTNHPASLVKGMLRPGRLDALIELKSLDAVALRQLITKIIQPELLASDINYEALLEGFAKMSPAFASEAIQRSLLFALADEDGEGTMGLIGTSELSAAVESIAAQMQLMSEADHRRAPDRLEETIGSVVADTLTGHRVNVRGGGQLEQLASTNGHRH